MIFEGIKLMFIGMITVMLFLTLTIYLIQLVSRLASGATAREMAAIKQERALLAKTRMEKQASTQGNSDEVIAAITAAVTAYEAEKFALR